MSFELSRRLGEERWFVVRAAPAGTVHAAWYTGPQAGRRQVSAFEDRQCESAIRVHQTGLDNKPPEYKGSTVLFHYIYIFLFPRKPYQTCWRSPTAQSLSLWHSNVIPSTALWLRWHPYVTTVLMSKVSCSGYSVAMGHTQVHTPWRRGSLSARNNPTLTDGWRE